MAKQLTAPGCKYSIVARVDTTIYSPDQTWTLDVPAGQSDFIAETNEIIIPADAMMCRKKRQIDADLARVNLLGKGSGSLATFVTRAIEQIVGKGNVSVAYGAGKLTVSLALDTTDAQITAVESLLDRVLPRNIATEMEWADGLPIDYTHVEYLENINGGDNNAWEGPAASIRTDIYPTQNTRGKLVAEAVMTPRTSVYYAFGCSVSANQSQPFGCAWWYRASTSTGNEAGFTMNFIKASGNAKGMRAGIHTLEFGKDGFKVDGVLKGTFGDIGEFKSPRKLMFLSETPASVNVRCFRGKAYSFQLWEGDEPILNFIPALDAAGAPCFFDTVTRKPYYSVAKGDFTYPGSESASAATTYSLRAPRPYRPEYAKDTGRGIARLYRVPARYNGSIEAYAAANGYKWLVENEQPEVGYWNPEWRETETQLILDWVETEPPAEDAPTTQAE